jgi:CheY-specific phosphatase CheX
VTKTVRELLIESAQNALEIMCFSDAEVVSGEVTTPEGELLAASLTFEGAPSGSFGLLISANAARSVATNFLAADDEARLTAAEVSAVIGELANMICGAMLSELESDATFDISEPGVAVAKAGEIAPDWLSGSQSAVRFELAGGAIALYSAFDN